MTLEQLAYLGEIVAAFSVVASLIYVAKQLGQSTAMMRANASHERVQRDRECRASPRARAPGRDAERGDLRY